jgi:osmotically-inducible protein OsmY
VLINNRPLEDDVIASLEDDPRIPTAADIAVAGDGGIVTLRGTVQRFSQRLAAAEDARNIEGVYEVINDLRVSLLGSDRRADDELRGAALQNLVWDADVPSGDVDVHIKDGWITLKGDVRYQFQSDAAYGDVSSLYGVLGVTNEIKVTNP